MGNCLKHERNMEWDGEDDWVSLTPKNSRFGNRIIDDGKNFTRGIVGNVEKQRLLGENNHSSSTAATTTSSSGSKDQVKFKITKKELEELVRRDMEEGLSLEEFLSSLVNTGNDSCRIVHHRTWRPILQSIPEVN